MSSPALDTFSLIDADEIHALEKSVTEFPWAKESIVSSLNAGHYCYCFRNDGRIVAFAIMSLVLDEATLLNIAVSRDQQRQGYGRQLLELALQQVQEDGAGMCVLEVRESNRHAQALYYELGFYEMGHRANYYPGKSGREDALLMCMPL